MDLRVALIGFGTGGSVFHAPLITSVPGLRLAAVVTRAPERQRAVRERYPEADVVDRADRLWGRRAPTTSSWSPRRTDSTSRWPGRR